jgi:hypothetical protein
VKIGRTVEKSFKGEIFEEKMSSCSPKMKFEKILKFLCVFACGAESLSMLIVKIG